jgi:carbon-monoxide dehydrogenase medium subunit
LTSAASTSLPALTVHRPSQVADAISLLRRLGDDAAIYGGGNELLVGLKRRAARYRHLVDVKGIDDLRGIEVDGDELRLGAAVTYADITRSRVVREHLFALADMARAIGNVRLRTTATLGGGLCHGDPRSEPATFLLAADASASWATKDDRAARMKLSEVVRASMKGHRDPGGLLTAVHVPLLGRYRAIAHRKVRVHERPAVTFAARLGHRSGQVTDARLAVGASGAHLLVTDAGHMLVGERASSLSAARLGEVAEVAAAAVDPADDRDGSAEFKRQLVRVLCGRCLDELLETAR